MYKDHPNIIKIREVVNNTEPFRFIPVEEEIISEKLRHLDKKKASNLNGIPPKILVENYDIFSPFLTKLINDSNSNMKFPDPLKLADISPIYKKDDATNKENYRLDSILPSVEGNMFDQISRYIEKYLSPYLCGFRKGFNAQHCLVVMLGKWKKVLDSGKFPGALLTDLSKAFDWINHNLLIAKLHAYGFDHRSLVYIYSYLSGRMHRTKVNNSFSSWAEITFGVPQGSILGPLLFNIYINDIFLFIIGTELANFADDNTPYAINDNVADLLNNLEHESSILIEWFSNNYLLMNADKSQLLVTKNDENISLNIDDEIIKGSKSVKLL